MSASHLVVTVLAATAIGLSAVANLIGHDFPKRQADKVRVPHSWLLPLGTLQAAAALGLLAGFAVPVLGTLAAAGLVLYFVGALVVHLRAGDHHLGYWSVFFVLSVAALIVNL
ncbi:DoxX family protein [Nonomuraea sp. NPDC050404]|uniref:DoxX family protein n=1 Tax=Nonomuraea sp. NPDC050404 TaxID=3155783 RepID=UPI0033DEB905